MSPDAMTHGPDDDAAGPEAELARVLDAFLADVEAGRPADPDLLLAEHPSLADRLREYLPLLGLGGSSLPAQPEEDPGPVTLDAAAFPRASAADLAAAR